MQDKKELIDSVITLFNRLSYTGGSVTLASLIAYKEAISIIFSGAALLFTALTFFISFYFQYKRNKREDAEEQRRAHIFEQVQKERQELKKT